MNFRQLRYFCEVVDSGTLTRAAERLFVAPTAISMQIAQLEESVGGALFDRSAKPMTLTPLAATFCRARANCSERASGWKRTHATWPGAAAGG